MEEHATGRPCAGEEALARALAACHDTLAAKIALLETEQAAGGLTTAQAAEQARAAQAVYERDCGVARLAADTGWHTWAGVGGILYARRPKSTPPMVVRAATPEALAEAIERAEGAMLETCGSAGEGCTFPVSESRSQAMAGVGAPAGKVQPLCSP